MTAGYVKRDEYELDRWLRKQSAKATEMLEGWGMRPSELISSEIGWLMCLPKYKNNPLVFDFFQRGFLTTRARLRCMLKGRQVGFSFGIACEALARCHLKPSHTAVCVSYNLDDAKEKIRYIKELHEELPLQFQKEMVIDSKTEVGYASNSTDRKLAKVVSFPSKPPRGKSGDVYLDELAHCQNDATIYQGATAVISRSGGQLTVGSTPMGQRGIFYDIHTEHFNKYPGFWRQEVPWWLCQHFCRDVAMAAKLAPGLPTQVRVERYGTQALIDQFNALPLEDFQQEFELVFQDERVSFYPYDLINPCATKEAEQIPVYSNIAMLAEVMGKLGPLHLGFDVGRSKHPSELYVFERQGEQFIMRYTEQFRDMPFPQQRERLFQICDLLGEHMRVFRIDDTGLGKNLAEDLLQKYGSKKIVPVTFTNEVKEQIANNLKILFQEQNIVLPRDRAIIGQIHSIKQKITPSGNTVFDAERSRTHHGDKMWAIGLATFRKRAQKKVAIELHLREIGAPQEIETGRELGPQQHPTLGAQIVAEVSEQVKRERAEFNALSTTELLAKSKKLAIAWRVWRREGNEEKAREVGASYRRLRREIELRKRVAALTRKAPAPSP